MKIKRFKIFESSVFWDEYINKIKNGILPKDEADYNTINYLTNMIPSGSKVLDLSFGDGSNSEFFIKKDFDVYGTDISDLAVEAMKDKYPDYTWISHDTLDKFPFPDNNFNLVFARLALHYFEKKDIERIFLDINRILKNNGYLYIMVKCSDTGVLNTGKNLYDSEEWSDMISKGFEIIEINEEKKKAYSYEKESNLLEIIAEK